MTTVVLMSSVTAAVFGGFDHWVWRQLVHHPFLTIVARQITDVGTLPVLVPVSVLGAMLIWWRYRLVILAVSPWCALHINSASVAVLKRTFSVARPPHALWLTGAGGGSFPSGHTANTTSVLVAFALIIYLHEQEAFKRRIVISGAILGCGLMGWTRLALNVHWLSDVFAGWAVGAFFAVSVVFLAQRLSTGSDKSHI